MDDGRTEKETLFFRMSESWPAPVACLECQATKVESPTDQVAQKNKTYKTLRWKQRFFDPSEEIRSEGLD